MTEEEFKLYKSLCKACQLNSKTHIINSILLLLLVIMISCRK